MFLNFAFGGFFLFAFLTVCLNGIGIAVQRFGKGFAVFRRFLVFVSQFITRRRFDVFFGCAFGLGFVFQTFDFVIGNFAGGRTVINVVTLQSGQFFGQGFIFVGRNGSYGNRVGIIPVSGDNDAGLIILAAVVRRYDADFVLFAVIRGRNADFVAAAVFLFDDTVGQRTDFSLICFNFLT